MIKRQRKSISRAERMTDSSLQNVGNGMALNNGKSAIVAVISLMRELLISSITSMKDTIDQLPIEEGPSEEIDEHLQIAAKTVN